MTRIVKKPDERRKELIDAAYELFQVHGYSATSINAVIQKIGVAKGTFYHYFKSKEDILEAVVQDLLANLVDQALGVAMNPAMTAMEKMKLLLGGQLSSSSKSKVVDGLHEPENRELHEKINIEIVLQLSPVFAKIIEQGVEEGIFEVDQVLETVQFMMVGSQFLFDHGLFPWNQDELIARRGVMARVFERNLGVEKGTFDFLLDTI